MKIKRVLKNVVLLETENKRLKKLCTKNRKELKDCKEQLETFMDQKNITQIDAGNIKIFRKTSKRVPPLNREFLLECLKEFDFKKNEGIEALCDHIFNVRKERKIEKATITIKSTKSAKAASEQSLNLHSIKEEAVEEDAPLTQDAL